MPRPVRTRKASRVPSQRESSATPAPITKKPATAPAPNPSSDIYSVSEEEKERQRKRAEARRTQQSNDVHDVSEKEKERVEARQTLLELNPERVNALEDVRRKRDTAMDKLANISSTTKDADSGSADVLDSPAIELSRREDVSIAGPARRVTDVSGLDLDDSTFGNLDDSLEDSQHAIEDTRSGYRSTDTSSFNINLFKRRPRQSSIVGKDDAPIRPSSRGQNTPSISSHLNLSLFKRRAREPSILGTAQKDRSTRPASRATSVASRTSRTSRNGDVTGDEDSGPEDESTPLNLAKRRSSAATGADMTIEMSPTLPSRKRKSLDDAENGREKRPALEQGAAEAAEEEEVIHQSIEMDNAPMIPSTPLNRSISDHLSSPPQTIFDPNDPDMAPPASSSSSEGGSPVVWPSLDTLARRNYHHNSKRSAPVHKTPELEADDHSSVLSSPPSLTHSPNYNVRPRAAKAAAPPKKKAAPKPPVTTSADLTSLLPQRQSKKRASRKNKDPFEMEDSEVEAEQGSETEAGEGDELSVYVDPRTAARRRRVAQAGSANKSANAKSGSASKGRGSSSKKSKGKGKEVEITTPVRGGRNRNKNKPVKTYGSQQDEGGEIVVATDDDHDDDGQEGEENEEAEAEEDQRSGSPEETSQMMLDRLGEELQAAKKKFKEVDKWELSFEEVDRSSSPVDGR